MKILLQNSLFYPNLAGGAERSTYLLAKELSARGHVVDVLTTTGQRASHEQKKNLTTQRVPNISGTVYSGPAVGLYANLLHQPSLAAHSAGTTDEPARETENPSSLTRAAHHALNIYSPGWNRLTRQVLQSGQQDVLHTNNLVGMTVSIWQAARATGTPIVHTIRDLHLLCPRTTMMKADGRVCTSQCWSCRLFSMPKLHATRKVDVVTSPSRFSLEKHLQYGGFTRSRTAVVPNACEGIPEQVPDRTGRPRVRGLYLGTLANHKGIPLLMTTLEDLFQNPSLDSLHFAFAGAGELQTEVKTFCERYPDRMEYLGVVSGADKIAALQESDFVVIPSVWPEAFGRVILDGFSQGLPVIGTDQGGIPEVIRDGQDGLVVRPEQVELTTAIQRYVLDADLRLAHGQSARSRIAEFSLEIQARHFEDIYRDLGRDKSDQDP